MKVLIVGLGSIGKKHVDALISIDSNIEIYALRSSKQVQPYKSVINIFSFEEVKAQKFDFIIISNSTSEHKKSIELFKTIGCPLFIEKPLFYNLSIQPDVNALEKTNNITYVACNLRFLDCIKYVKNMDLDTNKINEVNIYCGSYLPQWRQNSDFRKNYSAIPELGGGVHLDLIHELDYLYWIFGIPNHIHNVFSNKSTLSIPAYDYANYCLEYSNFNVNVILNYYRRDAKRTFELVLEDRTLMVDLLKNTISDLSSNSIIFESEQKISDTYKIQLEYFIDTIKHKQNTFNTIKDAYNVLKICLDESKK